MNNLLKLDGTWEKDSKNPALASFILIAICGALFYFVQSAIINGYIFIDSFNNGDIRKIGNFIELQIEYYTRYKIFFLATTGIFHYLSFLILPVIIIKKWHTKELIKYFKYDRFNIKHIAVSAAGIVLLIPLVDSFSRIIYRLFPVFEKLNDIASPLFTSNNTAEFILIVFIICVTPAVCEETLFRGYFQRTIQRKIKFPWHFIISGVVFALFHRRLLSLPALIIVGIYLGFIYYNFNSIYVSMISHFIYNLLLILMVNTEPPDNFIYTAQGFSAPVLIVSIILFILINLVIFLKMMRKSKTAQS